MAVVSSDQESLLSYEITKVCLGSLHDVATSANLLKPQPAAEYL